jgi:hypothetical protein
VARDLEHRWLRDRAAIVSKPWLGVSTSSITGKLDHRQARSPAGSITDKLDHRHGPTAPGSR